MDLWLRENLVCPRDHSHLQVKDDTLLCPVGHVYPYVDGIPIMLLKEAKVTVGAFYDSFKFYDSSTRPDASHALFEPDDGTGNMQCAIDPYVQHRVAATCGRLYKHLLNRLSRYPIPELRLPRASGQRLLDVGCGWGRWCVSAARRGYAPVGIDPSIYAIRAARRVARQLGASVNYVVADARHLPFTSRSFDVVFSYSVLQHFSKEDARSCLAEIARVLKVSGVGMIQMANMFGLRNFYQQLRRGFREPSSFEVRYWSVSELRRTFSAFIGPTSWFVDSYFSLNSGASDRDLLPIRYRFVVVCSEILRRLSGGIPGMKYVADSLYMRSIRVAD